MYVLHWEPTERAAQERFLRCRGFQSSVTASPQPGKTKHMFSSTIFKREPTYYLYQHTGTGKMTALPRSAPPPHHLFLLLSRLYHFHSHALSVFHPLSLRQSLPLSVSHLITMIAPFSLLEKQPLKNRKSANQHSTDLLSHLSKQCECVDVRKCVCKHV